jgi:import receptor subunit TOM70
MEAAQCFTEALDLIADQSESAALARQALTLLNNRSAMYEKASLPELALEDCDAVLTRDPLHSKGRLRKLRLLESLQRYYDGLVQVCAIQLIFMQANRTNLRMGLPTPTPPIPQSKMEDILQRVLPQQVDKYVQQLADPQKERPLPSAFTIGQLLRSYSDYNTWNAAAARDGSIEGLTKRLSVASLTETERVTLLMKRGRRKVYEKEYAAAMGDLEQAYALTEANTALQHELEGDTYARLLEWIGMVWHWQHKLTEATACYQKCADLEPTKAILLVKQAGIQMDSGEQDQAMALLDMALGVDSKSVDALLHRSNLNMLRANPEPARKDLEACVSIRPSHTTARLRLASILAAANDVAAAESQLAAAEMAEPGSSEVQSYKGELLFMKGEMASAKEQFERAIELEAANPTPYVNVAMAILNTPPPPGEMPDAQAVMGYLEKAIKVDPQFMAAYIQLGQIKLGTATDLIKAREVIELYDVALEYCRSPEEIKEVCSMRILAVAQVDAATMLNMESFNMQ